jgi:ABC-type Zn uptake system ZnuABC Zn-binding protein ZnuA
MLLRGVAAALVLLLAACTPATAPTNVGPAIVATTSMLASLASGVTGTPVKSLVPVGVSPEDYQPAPHDIAALHDATVLVENGAGLESWLDPTIRDAANPQLHLVVCTQGLPVRDGNPHLWMDPVFARAYVEKIREALVAADPAHAATYTANAAAYDAKLVALYQRTRAKIDTIPPPNRALIVFHNALDYYGRRFGIRIIGAIEPTAGAEPNPAHMAELVRLAKANHVRAVFAEHEFSPKLAQTLQESAGIKQLGYVYDDSVGTASDVADYIGVIDYDTNTIVAALK